MAKYEIITDKLNNFFTNNKINIADAKPTQGSYTKGDLIIAKSPTKDVYGWICTATGSPGTWQVLKSAADIKLTWGNITDKPSTFPPASHNHDTVYYKKAEVDTKLATKSDTSHIHDERYHRINLPVISGGADINGYYTVNGTYNVSASTTVVNAPWTGAIYGKLSVFIRSTGDVIQRFTSSDGKEYIRNRSASTGGKWSAWTKVFSSAQKPTWGDVDGKPSTFPPIIGTSSTTAYRGDYGQIAYNHSQSAHAPSNAQKNSDITKAEIEAKLTGDIKSHSHSSINIPDGRDANHNNPSDLPKGMEIQFKAVGNVSLPWGSGHTNIMNVKGWHDGTGGRASQMSFGSGTNNLPDLCARVGLNDAEQWGEWVRFYHSKDMGINTGYQDGVDNGFGSSTKPNGYVGYYPGWDKNTLFINAMSNKGLQAASYSTVRVLGDKLDVAQRVDVPNIHLGRSIRFGDGNYGADNYISYGNGDGSSFETHNMIMRTWWSIGIRDNSDTCRILFNARAGDVMCKGMVSTEAYLQVRGSKIYAQGDDPGAVGAGSVWIKTV